MTPLMWWLVVAPGALLLATLLVVVVVIPYRFTSRRYRKLISRIPGPRGLPVLGNALMVVGVSRAGMIPFLKKLHDTYGSFFKINVLGVTHVMCTDIDEIEKSLSSMNYITKSFDYLLLTPWLGDGLLVSTGAKWHARRKMLTPAFHFRILEDYLPVFTRCSNVLVEKLRACVGQGSVPVNDFLTLCTLDIICETAMGTRMDAQEGKAVEYVEGVKRMSELFQTRQLKPWLWRPLWFAISPTGFEHRRVISKLHAFTNKVIKERQSEYRAARENVNPDAPKKKRKLLALLDLLLEVAESNPGALSLEDIREEVDTFMFEGHDTTSAALSWAIYLLALNPKEQEKAAAEQAEIFGDSTRDPTMADLSQMRYLEQVIKEALRIYPSVPAFSRLLESDITLCGHTVPEGALLTISPLLVHQDASVYPEPQSFKPERFDPDTSAGRHPFAYIPFSAGPRGCIGQRFALLEEKAVLSAVLRNFRLEAVDRPEEVTPLMELVLRPERPLRVKFLERTFL